MTKRGSPHLVSSTDCSLPNDELPVYDRNSARNTYLGSEKQIAQQIQLIAIQVSERKKSRFANLMDFAKSIAKTTIQNMVSIITPATSS